VTPGSLYPGSYALAVPFGVFLSSMTTGAAIYLTAKTCLGERSGPIESCRVALRRLISLVGAALLPGLAVAGLAIRFGG
jgi:hypothetical protein